MMYKTCVRCKKDLPTTDFYKQATTIVVYLVIAEVKKTVCLCANCHKEFHHFYGIKPLNPVKDLEEYLNKTGVTEDELI